MWTVVQRFEPRG